MKENYSARVGALLHILHSIYTVSAHIRAGHTLLAHDERVGGECCTCTHGLVIRAIFLVGPMTPPGGGTRDSVVPVYTCHACLRILRRGDLSKMLSEWNDLSRCRDITFRARERPHQGSYRPQVFASRKEDKRKKEREKAAGTCGE